MRVQEYAGTAMANKNADRTSHVGEEIMVLSRRHFAIRTRSLARTATAVQCPAACDLACRKVQHDGRDLATQQNNGGDLVTDRNSA